MNARLRCTGFTLIEMIIVIVLTGIIASIVAAFVSGPVLGFMQTSRRAELVDAAELALQRMTRDVRRALPNSIRVDASGTVIEMLNVVDAGRYRSDPPPGNPANLLDFSAPDTDFDVLGPLQNFASINPSADEVVIYNLSATGPSNNAYVGDNRAALNSAATTASHIQLAAAMQFPLASPRQRFYVIDTPVTYLCNVGGGVLQRYDGYAITASHSGIDEDSELTTAGATRALMTEHVSACAFTYQPGTSQRAGLISLRLVLSDGGENVTLLHQVHVYNTP